MVLEMEKERQAAVRELVKAAAAQAAATVGEMVAETAVATVEEVAMAWLEAGHRRALSRPRREDYDQYRMGL